MTDIQLSEIAMYHATQYIIGKADPLFPYMEERSHAANNLHNTALFYIRQVFTGTEKAESERLPAQKEVFEKIETCLPLMNAVREKANRKKEEANQKIRERNTEIARENEIRQAEGGKPLPLIEEKRYSKLFEMPTADKSFVGFGFLEALLKASRNECYFAECLPRQTAQAVLKNVCGDFQNWFAALREYKRNADRFTGRPRMPKYRKSGGLGNIPFTNQDCVIQGSSLKLPGTKTRLALGDVIPADAVLKQVEVCPYYGQFKVCVVWEDGIEPPEPAKEPECVAAIDFGVDNLAAMANNMDRPGLLFKGGIVKAENQWFNKQKAQITSRLTHGREMEKYPRTHRLDRLSSHREGVLRTQINTCARQVVDQCREWKIDTLVLGVNRGWKQGSVMGSESNQKFVGIPHDRLRRRIRELAEAAGIRIVEQEESYTSKASFPDFDPIPVYGEPGAKEARFSGYRETRGNYKLKGRGTRINADLNAAGNILRKAFPELICPQNDRFLREIIVFKPGTKVIP